MTRSRISACSTLLRPEGRLKQTRRHRGINRFRRTQSMAWEWKNKKRKTHIHDDDDYQLTVVKGSIRPNDAMSRIRRGSSSWPLTPVDRVRRVPVMSSPSRQQVCACVPDDYSRRNIISLLFFFPRRRLNYILYSRLTMHFNSCFRLYTLKL